ncbi:hypothetical protein ACO1O0_000557 [Amphichorda felina]
MESKETQDTPRSRVQKHRACDKCRSRKLACSKEPTGCSRCCREGIICHYSPQKPMGRPRKRRMVEEPAAAVEDSSAASSADQPCGNHTLPPVNLPGDPSLGFLDEPPSPNLDFMDLPPYDYQDNTQLDPRVLFHNDGAADEALTMSLNGVDLLSTINFNEDPDSSAGNMSKDISSSLQRYWETQNLEATEPSESMPSDLSNSANSAESLLSSSADPAVSPTVKAVPSVACGCLSSLYLALDSLSRLPPDVMGAMRTARHATVVAHDVIQCPTCSDPFGKDPTKPAPIQSLQSSMCLAALIPSACNAYATILEMVDKEAAAVKRENRTIWFSFRDVGGLWAIVGPSGHNDCLLLSAYNNRNMEPDIWRITMRAILRIDVYGFDESSPDVPSPSSRVDSLGLRDVVRLLELRSARRHDRMDRLAAAGKMPEPSGYLLQQPYKSVPREERHCIRILEAARIALDNLVIA